MGAGYGCYLSSHDEVARLPTLVDQFERQAFRPEILQSLISADDARLVVWVAGVKAPEVLRHAIADRRSSPMTCGGISVTTHW